ncbi:hypothetical protein BP6252_04528 [Coleophoma cylindrospora]|uniref:BZIP domain-containing protein n=1 Tax=Coleophoma cylindrospora TaxID=1849047 RepID=A0A3D8S174_9HELO|nr:hypothetical protein BP6252_04528 [Coleophoma cylindrospora]
MSDNNSNSNSNTESTSEGDNSDLNRLGGRSAKAGAKRRASRAGTRSVATLSEAQLARKRANDREAQRLIRRRTKDHIEQLERHIQELSEGQGTTGELEELRRRNAELETELSMLRGPRSLSEEGIVGQDGKRINQDSLPRRPSAPTSYPSSYITADESMSTSRYSTPDSSWPPRAASFTHPFVAESLTGTSSSNASFTSAYPGYESPSMLSSVVGSPIGMVSPIAPPRSDPGLGDVSDKSWLPMNDPRMMPIPILSDASQPNPERRGKRVAGSTNDHSTPSWELPIRTLPPTGPIDNIIISLVQQQRNKIVNGDDVLSTIGPHQPSMNAIVYSDQTATSHHVSTILSDLLKNTALQRIPERAAALYFLYHLVQWQIYPSKSTYDQLLTWQIPRTTQIITPHPAWVDFIAWPKLRDEVICNLATYGSEDFQHVYTSSLNVNWHWGDTDAFVIENDGQVVLSMEFKNHVSNLANWSLDAPFARRYPELERLCKFTESGPGQRYV